MVLDLGVRSGLEKSTNGLNMERSDNTMLETLLPQILEAVGSGYNHIEGRVNDVQNKRLPSLEAQIHSFDQSQAQTKESINQLLGLKQRLDAAEAKGNANETLSHTLSSTVKKLEAKATSTGTDASRVKALAQRLEKLEADRIADRNLAEGPSFESFLESVQKLSDTVQKFQGEKEADARKIQSLTETVKKLQSDRAADGDRLQANSDHLKKLEAEQHEAHQNETSKLDDISDELDKVKADRASDASRIQATLENLNKLQSQQAEKANRTSLNVVSEKINKLQADEKGRQSEFEVVGRQNRKLEDRIDNIEKQYKYLDDQSRKTETFYSEIASVAATAQGIQRRVENLERRDTGAAAANQTTLSLFKRVEKLEGRDAGVARVNAEAQTLLKRVDKMSGACADIEQVGANTQALATRLQKLEGDDFDVRVEKLEKKSSDVVDLADTIKTLRTRIEKLESRDCSVLVEKLEKKKTSSKRTFDTSNQDNEDELAMPSRKRSRSEAGRAKALTERIERFHKRGPTRDRNAASSPAAPPRFASRKKETAQVAGASEDEGSEEQEGDSDVAPRRTSRTVKPTERGSHLPFLDVTARRNS